LVAHVRMDGAWLGSVDIAIKRDGVVIGAVGASGGSVEQDVSVARAALAGF